jgi:hypothetical protein
VSPYGEVPVLQDTQGRILAQSNAILQYLAHSHQLMCGQNDDEWWQIVQWLSWKANRIGFSLPNLRYRRRFEPIGAQLDAYLEQRLHKEMAQQNQTPYKSDKVYFPRRKMAQKGVIYDTSYSPQPQRGIQDPSGFGRVERGSDFGAIVQRV